MESAFERRKRLFRECSGTKDAGSCVFRRLKSSAKKGNKKAQADLNALFPSKVSGNFIHERVNDWKELKTKGYTRVVSRKTASGHVLRLACKGSPRSTVRGQCRLISVLHPVGSARARATRPKGAGGRSPTFQCNPKSGRCRRIH